jgi:tetratricopeptide (TPR) repeat protein
MKPVDQIIPSIDLARAAESEDRLEEAAKIYEEIFVQEPLNETVANRLMIIYRKLKLFKKELKVINKGVKSFEAFYRSRSRHRKNKAIAELSSALSIKTGLTDKKGNAAFEPEPIAKWKKRKLVVEKKLAG